MTDLIDLEAFHASPHRFDHPDYERILANTTNHANSLLGLWVALRDDWIRGFGQHVYAVTFAGRGLDLTVAELTRWNRMDEGASFYVAKREELLANGIDYLRLVEAGGQSDMGIIVNFDKIVSFKPLAMAAPRP